MLLVAADPTGDASLVWRAGPAQPTDTARRSGQSRTDDGMI